MSFAQRQRHALLDAMHELGPFAETACEGWQAQDLAAHLWIREHRPCAMPGIGIERFAPLTARIQQESLHKLGFLEILDQLRRAPLAMRLMDPIVGATEWYIHHEDLLRPAGRRVKLTDEEQHKLVSTALMLAPMAQRGKPYRLVITPEGGTAKTFGRGQQIVYLDGLGSELLLHLSGRDSDVRIVADDAQAYLAGRSSL